MRDHRNTQPHLRPQILRLHVTLSDRLDAAAIEQWRERLNDHVSAHGLVAALSPESIAVLTIGEAITTVDRSLVVSWLMDQTEVVFVHIERRASASRPRQLGLPPSARGRRLSALAIRPTRRDDQQRRPSSRAGPG